MKYVLTADEMKRTDQQTMERFGMLSAVLMERAALAIKRQVLLYRENGHILDRVLIVCGSGNNGGDGFAAARLLLLEGVPADVWFPGNERRMTEECRRQKEIFEAYSGKIYNRKPAGEYSVIIDAVFGVGLKREVTGDYADALKVVNEMKAYKIAVDIPSGISADSGQILGTAFQADLTVTFGFLKRGLCLYPGRRYAGEIVLDDVGITEHSLVSRNMVVLEQADIRKLLPCRQKESHKGSYGKVLVIAGSEKMSGAAFLAAKAAYICGAGLVKIYTHQTNRSILAGLLPEALIDGYDSFELDDLKERLEWADVVIIGPGLSKCKISVNLVKETLSHCTKPCIIDADAINIVSDHPEFAEGRSCRTVFTPHMMEMGRLTGKTVLKVSEQRSETIKAVLDQFADVCVLKDSVTVTADRTGKEYMNQSGCSALSKGGSGDILTGIIAGFIAQGMDLTEAAALAVYMHGTAGEKMSSKKGYYSVLASDLLEGLAELLREFGDEK